MSIDCCNHLSVSVGDQALGNSFHDKKIIDFLFCAGILKDKKKVKRMSSVTSRMGFDDRRWRGQKKRSTKENCG